MSEQFLTINQVLKHELGIDTYETDYTISCPTHHHRDSNPSCRVYPNSDDSVGSLYCWGCGFSASPVSLIKELKQFNNYREVFEYIEIEYNVKYPKSTQYESQNYGIIDLIQYLKYYNKLGIMFMSNLEYAIATSRDGQVSVSLRRLVSELIKNGL